MLNTNDVVVGALAIVAVTVAIEARHVAQDRYVAEIARLLIENNGSLDGIEKLTNVFSSSPTVPANLLRG